MENKRKIFLLLALMCMFTCLYFVRTTYAKYLTTASGSIQASIARWNIKVNNTTVRNNDVITNGLTPTFIHSDHIADNVIAPTSQGYFDLTIDATDVDVSFTYTVAINQRSDYSLLTDFNVTGYSMNGGTTIIPLSTPTLSADILKTDTTRVKTIRVYVQWIDGTGETMDNAADTAITNNYESVILDVVLTFTQKAS